MLILEIDSEYTCLDVDDPLPLDITLRNTSTSTITVVKTLRFLNSNLYQGSSVILNGRNVNRLITILENTWAGKTEYVSLLPNEGVVTHIENLWEFSSVHIDGQSRDLGHYDLQIKYENFVPGIVLTSTIDEQNNRLLLAIEENGTWIGELYSNVLSFDIVASSEECG